MAMIECPECGRRISDLADMCLGCGISQKTIQRLLAEKADQERAATEERQKTNAVSGQKQAKIAPASVITKKEELGVIRSEVQRQGMIGCSICKNTYQSSEEKCPKCKYPVFTVCSNSEKLRRQMKEFRKESGITELDLHVGQFYKMGCYQGEEISWKVLAVEDGKALLISEKGLDAIPYHNQFLGITWENCTLRSWLNTEFMDKAFSKEEKSRIPKMKITADKNPRFATDPGNDTEDQVFLLSIQEVEKYFADDEDRKAYPTEYAKRNGAGVYNRREKFCCWWLRSLGHASDNAAFVEYFGEVNYGLVGLPASCASVCIRPSLWVNL